MGMASGSEPDVALPTPVTATVSAREFQDSRLPLVCVHTGEPADTWVEASAKSRIGPQWFLLLLGVVVLVLVRVLTIKRAHGYLPINRAACDRVGQQLEARNVARRKRRLQRTRWVAVGAFVAGALAGTAWMLLEANWYETDQNRDLHAQRDFDELAARLPITARPDDIDVVITYELDGNGCIGSVKDYEDFDDEVETICRPSSDQVQVSGLGFSPAFWSEPVVSDDGDVLIFWDEWDSEPNTSTTDLNPSLNIATPIGLGLLAALAAWIIGWFIASSRKDFGIVPAMHLDRSGERLVIVGAHPRFAEATSNTMRPATMPPPFSGSVAPPRYSGSVTPPPE